LPNSGAGGYLPSSSEMMCGWMSTMEVMVFTVFLVDQRPCALRRLSRRG
jgi:hypothetical protein